ncbi:hypothetical protein HDV05_001039, partial [Chytridiales sp. JEL 0842]
MRFVPKAPVVVNCLLPGILLFITILLLITPPTLAQSTTPSSTSPTSTSPASPTTTPANSTCLDKPAFDTCLDQSKSNISTSCKIGLVNNTFYLNGFNTVKDAD